jgi:hypothetical protein
MLFLVLVVPANPPILNDLTGKGNPQSVPVYGISQHGRSVLFHSLDHNDDAKVKIEATNILNTISLRVYFIKNKKALYPRSQNWEVPSRFRLALNYLIYG